MSDERFVVRNEPARPRFALIDRSEDGSGDLVIGEESYLDFAAEPGGSPTDRIMFHTEVSEDYGGQGLASVLVDAAVTETIEAGLKVVPVCPYVAAWLRKHPEHADHVVQPRPEHLQALSASR